MWFPALHIWALHVDIEGLYQPTNSCLDVFYFFFLFIFASNGKKKTNKKKKHASAAALWRQDD